MSPPPREVAEVTRAATLVTNPDNRGTVTSGRRVMASEDVEVGRLSDDAAEGAGGVRSSVDELHLSDTFTH